ncbi:MAG: HAD family hydrolase [Haloarculaceae archaeon]
MVADAYDVWLLDLDGTLVDVEPGYVHDVMGRVGDRLGYDVSAAEAEAVWHSLGGDPNGVVRSWGIDPDRFWDVFHEEEDPLARAESTFLYDDAEWFAEVDAPLGLVTHCQSYLTDPVLEHVGIRDWFDTVVCCTDETGWKPDPEPVERALADMGLLDGPEGGILAGDGPHDVGAAWNAGLDAVHVERHGHDRRGLCVLGDHRVGGFDELRRRTAGGPAAD